MDRDPVGLQTARRTIEIRNVIVEGGGTRTPRISRVVPALVAIYAVIILSVVFFRPDTTAVILTVYATFAAYLYLCSAIVLPPEVTARGDRGALVVRSRHDGLHRAPLIP